jgi:hypothetical protein
MMSRYAYHVKTGEQILTGEEGADLKNLDTALTEAVESAKELAESVSKQAAKESKVVVTNEAGDIITTPPVDPES